MGDPKIIIIDDNGHNGDYLSTYCRRHFPEWQVSWLRVYTGEPDPPALPRGVAYEVIGNQEGAAAAIKREAGEGSDLIVFYDLQLIGVQDDTAAAAASLLTMTLKELMGQANRKMMVNVHSADLNSLRVAGMLDEKMQRVMSTMVSRTSGTDESDHRALVENVVAETLAKWESLYPSQSLSAEEFLCAMEGMRHEQIQNCSNFIKEASVAEGIKVPIARQKYQDPSDVLRRYLGMGTTIFEEHFCEGPDSLKMEVATALKGISGVLDFVTGKSEGRRLRWDGAWLLALGQFRRLSCRDRWKDVFDTEALGRAKQPWPEMHARQSPARRGNTVRLFVEMCGVLFRMKGTRDDCALERVSLTVDKNGGPQALSFLLSFPCINRADQTGSLLGRILAEADYALALTAGSNPDKESHDTSQAVWRFFLSSGVCDREDEVGLESDGMFGGHSRMNVISVNGGTKTKIVWLNQ